MTTSLTEVFNLALSACGSRGLVSNPDEQSREAALCRLWLPKTRDHILMTAPWPSARKYARLSLQHVREPAEPWVADDPAPGRARLFALPPDLLLPLHLQSFRHFEYQGGQISADEEFPILYYNARIESPADWDPQLSDAIIHYLAARIARPLTGKSSVVQEQFEIARLHIDAMITAVANMQEPRHESLPDWIAARGFAAPLQTRYHYPFAQLNAEASL